MHVIYKYAYFLPFVNKSIFERQKRIIKSMAAFLLPAVSTLTNLQAAETADNCHAPITLKICLF